MAKDSKIVQRITALTITGLVVGAFAVTPFLVDYSVVPNVKDETTQQTTGVGESGTHTENSSGVGTENTESTTNVDQGTQTEAETIPTVRDEEKYVGNVEVYNPVDFKYVSNYGSVYDGLQQNRIEQMNKLNGIISTSLFHSKEEIAAAVYNVVRLDADISSCLVKVAEEKRAEAQKELYLEKQLEILEDILKEINKLESQIDDSKTQLDSVADKIRKKDFEKIEKVIKFNKLSLQATKKALEKEIGEIKVEIESLSVSQ